MDLGDGILSPSSGPIPIAVWVEIGLEDRFQDQLEGHLGHPVPQGRNPERAELAALLRDHDLPHRQRGEGAVLQRGTQVLEEGQHPDVLFDVAAGHRIHASCLGAPLARHPLPGHQQRGPVANQVEHVAEPLRRFGCCPSVQLALVIEYPAFGPVEGRVVRCAAIQRLVATCHAADHAAALPHARGFPALGVLRRLRHAPMPTAGVAPAPRPTGCRAARAASGRFPRSLMSVTTGVGAQLYPGGIATGRTSQSWPGPPAAQITQTTEAGRPKATACPSPQSDPSTRFAGSPTTDGASATGSVPLRLSRPR